MRLEVLGAGRDELDEGSRLDEPGGGVRSSCSFLLRDGESRRRETCEAVVIVDADSEVCVWVGVGREMNIPVRVLALVLGRGGRSAPRVCICAVAGVSNPELSPLSLDSRPNPGPSVKSDWTRTWSLGGGGGGRSLSMTPATPESRTAPPCISGMS